MPFCSERCRQIDLGRWLGEGYSVPHLPSEDELEEAEAKEAAERRRDDDDQQEPTDDG